MATKRGSAERFFGRQIGIHYRILTKLDIPMGNMVTHHLAKFYQTRPIDGRNIGDALLFLVRYVQRVPEPKRVGTLPQK